MDEKELALEAIQKKLIGKRLNYTEIYAIMDEIAHRRLDSVLITYFAASGYSKGFTDEELYYLTRAMIETGDQLRFEGIVADKHSIGGVPGTRTSLIVVPIIASAGFIIPKSSSRAITTPGGTADDMEVLAPVVFDKSALYRLIKKTQGCIVWGGSINAAPADDLLIQVEEPLQFESFDKIVVSILAKKIAFGSNHIVIDLPYGEHMKVHKLGDAQLMKRKFEYLAEKFGIKVSVQIRKIEQPAGRGLGPMLEVQEALRVLERKEYRSLDLEAHAIHLASALLDLCLQDVRASVRESILAEFKTAKAWATYILSSGHAWKKMREIIEAQGGNSSVTSERLQFARYRHVVLGDSAGRVKKIHSKNSSIICKILGAPEMKKSGIWLDRKIGEAVVKNEPLYTLYSEKEYLLREAIDSLSHFPILTYE
jgi:AMP phosphorylase